MASIKKPFCIGGVAMDLPIIVGAGTCKTPASVLPYMRADVSVGAVSTGSYTPKPRTGNEGTLFWPDNIAKFMQEGIGLNSFGMPNMGNAAAAKELQSYSFTHPVIVSIAGFSADEYAQGVQTFNHVPNVSAIKLNVGCPNAHDQKTIPIAYDPDSLDHILQKVKELSICKPLWVKLSPYITIEERCILQASYPQIDFSNVPTVDRGFIGAVIAVLFDYQDIVKAVVLNNTLPNVIIHRDDTCPVTSPNGGKAGLSGRILKQISINTIREARNLTTLNIIGSGGVMTGDDVIDYLEAGADAVCCTSMPFWSGNDPRFFADLMSGSERLQTYLSQCITLS